jgi:nitrogenase delta subunit
MAAVVMSTIDTKMEEMVEYIMKKCLWQFHSRAWDRQRQNEGILTKTAQILMGESVENESPADRCYWVDAVLLAEAYRSRFAWLQDMDRDEIGALMRAVKDRMDFLTITGSLNLELSDAKY